MRCVTDPDVRVFADQALPWLSKDPVRHNLLAAVVRSRLEDPPGSELGAVCLRVLNDQHGLVAVAMRTPPRALLLSVMTAPLAQALADHLTARDASHRPRRLPGVDGPADASLAFMARYQERTGARSRLGLGTRIYRLDRPAAPPRAPGQLREATACDRILIVRWVNRFTAEAVPNHQPSDQRPRIDDRLTRGGMLWLWEVDGTPVSFLWLSPPIAGVVRIGAVYTPPPLREHGYASACVAAVSRHVLDAGATTCMLYADTANPTSNRIYLRIGFRPVEDCQEWLFSYP